MAENNNSLLAGIISIHAPPRGATHKVVALLALADISIHAPPRGATSGSVISSVGMQKFQFTPLREGRRPNLLNDYCVDGFQFTPLREGRRRHGVRRHGNNHFNSRPSARGDALSVTYDALVQLISIHAPPRGATMLGFPDSPAILFQFTPLREGRHEKGERLLQKQRISIHAPPRGATGD